jgi:hypothetical protein
VSALIVEPDTWPVVTMPDGSRWAVAPRYVHGVAIGEALLETLHHGCELPTPALVDEIWRAADCRLAPISRDPASPGAIEAQRTAIERQLAAWEAEQGSPARLVAGTHKDVVDTRWGRPGIYGWHRRDGTPIQPESAVHKQLYRDYSQGLRLVHRLGNPA